MEIPCNYISKREGGRSACRRNRRKPSWRAALVLSAVATLGLAACSSSSSKSSSPSSATPSPSRSTEGNSINLRAAQTAVAAAEQPPSFAAPGPTFNAKAAAGKTLWVINITSSIPLVQVTDSAAAQALGLVGARLVQYDGKGTVATQSAGIDEAIAQHASAIALFAIDPNAVAGPVQKAMQAGIPIIVMQYGDPGATMPFGLKAQVTYCYSCAGKYMADYIVANAGTNKTSVALIESTEVPNSKFEIQGFKSTYLSLCPSCSLYEQNVPVADWQTQIPTLTQSLIRSHPGLKYIVPIYDGMALFVVPAVHSAGAATSVKVVSFNATLGVMQDLASHNVVAADVGSPQAWEGWALADQFLRVVTGHAPVVQETAGLRLFDASNINSIDLSKPESTWYGVDFESVYKRIWGLG